MAILFMLASCSQSTKLNQVTIDDRANARILIDVCTREAFSITGFKEWFDAEYANYTLDTESLSEIDAEAFAESEILIIMGSWCGDSRREVPRFYKILDYMGYDSKKITLVNVNTSKKAKTFDVEKHNLQRVPTFIFLNNKTDSEIGRIIESPKITLEKDLVKIFDTLKVE